jgi:hypothetical protein
LNQRVVWLIMAPPAIAHCPDVLGAMFGEVRIGNESAMQNAKIGAAPFNCVKSGAA